MKKIIFSTVVLLCMIVGFVQFRNIKEIAATLFSPQTGTEPLIAINDILPADSASVSLLFPDTTLISSPVLDTSSTSKSVTSEKSEGTSVGIDSLSYSVSKAKRIDNVKFASPSTSQGTTALKVSAITSADPKFAHPKQAIADSDINLSELHKVKAEENKAEVNNSTNAILNLKMGTSKVQIPSSKAVNAGKLVSQDEKIKSSNNSKDNDTFTASSEYKEKIAPTITMYASVITPKSEEKAEIIKAYINEKLAPSEPEKSVIALQGQEKEAELSKIISSGQEDSLTVAILPKLNKAMALADQPSAKPSVNESDFSSTASYKTVLINNAPNISYNSLQKFTVGMPINPLIPMNSGSAIPATIYGHVSTIAGGGFNGESGSKNGISFSARFYYPYSSVVDTRGNIYVTDQGNSIIRKITPSGVVSTLAGSGTAGYADGIGVAASFSNPKGLAIDSVGNIYVADAVNNRIRKVTSKGVVTTIAGNGNTGFIDGFGTQASFYNPSAIAIDALGNLYVADEKNHAIRKISAFGEVNTLAGNGSAGAINGTGAEASFSYPSGIALDVSGNVYVADFSNQKIRKITPEGLVSTVAGTGSIGRLNGPEKVASFHNPTGISIDNSGNLYVADAGNHQIRMISNKGIVSTLPCTESAGLITNSATNTGFYNPSGVMADTKGSVYVTDQNNNRIRKVGVTGYTISPALPSGLSFDSATGTVSGTPTIASELTEYVITAYNNNGSSTTTLKLATLSQTGAATASNSAQ